MPDALSALAPAKVNLFLHIRGQRPDGKHTLESLAVFPQLGDVLSVEPADSLSLTMGGPFGIDLGAGDDNLVVRAVTRLAGALGTPPRGAFHLDKRLPVASGVGGGSTDAAAALRLAGDLWGERLDHDGLHRLALNLGADVPVCLGAPTPAMMHGIGETMGPAPRLPAFWLLLVNPLRGLSTAAVFSELERRINPPGPTAPHGFNDAGALVAWLACQRNDLEQPARQILPVIATVLGALRWQTECRLARMSGSGATCFGIFETETAALDAAAALRKAEPAWWVAPCLVVAT